MKGVLTGKVALVTGGGTGIGRSIAERFVEESAQVIIAGIDKDSLCATATALGENCEWRLCDVAQVAQVDELMRSLKELDIVVNNAAVSFPIDALEASLEEWQRLMEVNLWGVVHCCRAGAHKMIKQGRGGRIINISSVQGRFAEAGSAHYGMAKAAIEQLTRQLAVEWARHDILVNAIAPGYIDTPLSRVTGENELETPWFQEYYVRQRKIPLARAGRPEEIAEAALFLAHPRNTYVTGQVVAVDGGLSVTF